MGGEGAYHHLALKMEIKLTKNVKIKAKGGKRTLKLHFRMRALHAVLIQSYIKGCFVEWKEIKEEKEGEFSLDYRSKKKNGIRSIKEET